jgi:translation elongation factor EF-1beta
MASKVAATVRETVGSAFERIIEKIRKTKTIDETAIVEFSRIKSQKKELEKQEKELIAEFKDLMVHKNLTVVALDGCPYMLNLQHVSVTVKDKDGLIEHLAEKLWGSGWEEKLDKTWPKFEGQRSDARLTCDLNPKYKAPKL